MITLFFQVDVVMLEQMRSAEEAGWYRAPVFVLEGLTLIPRILGYALIPTMAALFQPRPGAVTELYRRGSKYLLVVSLPIATFGALRSDPFIPTLFGSEYGPSVAVSVVLLPVATFMFLSNFAETTLACINRWWTIVTVSTVALVLNVALNLLWIPTHGYYGAAWATVLTEGTYFLLSAGSLSAYGHRIGWLRIVWRPVLATLVFGVVLWLGGGLHLLVSSVLASGAFGLATIALGVWDARERELLLGLLRGARPDARRLTSDE
jgi:O-antigen/teichoic acid export membrane protein